MNQKGLVSVIITTKNEEAVIARLILSVNKQTYPNKEIILVDNYSSDRTIEIANKMGLKTYSLGPERSTQRNFGAKKSKGKYFLFLDADMKLSPGVISECIKTITKENKIGAVIIPEKSIATNFWEEVKAFERSFYNEEGDEVTDAARFFSKKAFTEANGYDETITGPEDWDLPERVKKSGYRIDRIKPFIFHYERIKSPFELAKKKFYYALRSHRYLSKQRIPVISSKTIYFLRPVFYKHVNKFIDHPILTMGLFVALTMELFGGGFGYLIGRIKKL